MHQLISFFDVGRFGPALAPSPDGPAWPWWRSRRASPHDATTGLSRRATVVGPGFGQTPLVRPARAVEGAEESGEDVCRYLFRLCKRLDGDYLRPRDITFMFDVTGGWLDGERCQTTGLLIAALVLHTVAGAPDCLLTDGIITISLHQKGGLWSGSIVDSGIAEPMKGRGVGRGARVPPLPAVVARLAADLNARLDHGATRDGTRTVFEFRSTG